MIVKDLMKKNVETLTSTATLRDAAERMRAAGVGFLPIIEGGKLAGVVTDRDLVTRGLAAGMDPHALVTRVRTAEVAVCYPNDTVPAARTVMEQNLVRRLVVVNEKREPVGVISLDDLTRAPGEEAHALMEHLVRPVNRA